MPRRRHPIRIPLLLSIAGVAGAIVAYVLGLAELQSRGNSLYEPTDLYIPRLIDVVIFMWCIWVGSSIGSFLNVVAWRMPRGESINGRSHCPRCQAKLRARDNFPVFGWLALGGRCHTCHLPISSRYPIVEAAVGLSLTLIAVGELYRFSLPRQALHWHGGPLWAPEVNATLLLTLLYHIVAVAVCWAFGLIRMDGHRLPGRLVGFGLAAAAIPMILFPTLMVVPWQMDVPADWRPHGLFVDALLRVITALATATVAARYLARGLCPAADPKLDPLGQSTARLIDLIVILSVPTIVIGWQAAPAVIVVASVIAVGARSWLPQTCDTLGRFAIAMPITLTFQIFFWRRLHATTYVTDGDGIITYWPSDTGSPWVFLFWCALVGMAPLWLREEPQPEPATGDQSRVAEASEGIARINDDPVAEGAGEQRDDTLSEPSGGESVIANDSEPDHR